MPAFLPRMKNSSSETCLTITVSACYIIKATNKDGERLPLSPSYRLIWPWLCRAYLLRWFRRTCPKSDAVQVYLLAEIRIAGFIHRQEKFNNRTILCWKSIFCRPAERSKMEKRSRVWRVIHFISVFHYYRIGVFLIPELKRIGWGRRVFTPYEDGINSFLRNLQRFGDCLSRNFLQSTY